MTPINLPEMFGEVLKWNILFGVPIPDNNIQGILSLIKEEYTEFTTATNIRSRNDAIGDLIVVTLGACARLVTMPQRCPHIIKLAGQLNQTIRINSANIQGVYDSLSSGNNVGKGLSEFLEIIFTHCELERIDIVPVFNEIMKANWTKYWKESELQLRPAISSIKFIGGWVVYSKSGKILKPPSFVHP